MRNNVFRRINKALSCAVLVTAVTLSGIQLPNVTGQKSSSIAVADAATVTDRLPIVAYTRYSGNLNTYTDVNLTNRTGYICSYDKCTILQIYSNGAVQVRYPVSRGTRVAYASMSGFFVDENFSTSTGRFGKGKTAYRKSTGGETIGSVYADDDVAIIGLADGRTQVLYPTSSGFKLGWVDGLYQIERNENPPASEPAGNESTPSGSNSESIAANMVAYELSQLGIGDRRGNNNVEYNTWYYNRAVSGSGHAWCMTFQAYCCYKVTGSNDAIPKTASCTAAVNEFKRRGQFQYSKYYGGNYTPKAGDLVFYTSNRGRNSCHVGMIIGAPVNGYLQTIEGNIKCSDGNWKVVKFTRNSKRKVNNSYVWGYATPGY